VLCQFFLQAGRGAVQRLRFIWNVNELEEILAALAMNALAPGGSAACFVAADRL
jgi:hypothetical protein